MELGVAAARQVHGAGCVRASASPAWVAPEVPHSAWPVPPVEEVMPSSVLDLSSWGGIWWTPRDQPFGEEVVDWCCRLPFA